MSLLDNVLTVTHARRVCSSARQGVGIVLTLSIGLVGLAVNAVSAGAAYGTTPALQLPWAMGTQWDVSGFSYWYTGDCSGVTNTHTGLEKYALDFGLANGTAIYAAAY